MWGLLLLETVWKIGVGSCHEDVGQWSLGIAWMTGMDNLRQLPELTAARMSSPSRQAQFFDLKIADYGSKPPVG